LRRARLNVEQRWAALCSIRPECSGRPASESRAEPSWGQQANAPKYYLELAGAGHFAWTDLRAQARQLVQAVAIFKTGRTADRSPAAIH